MIAREEHVATHPLEIEADKLHRLCDPKQLDFETTQDLASLAGTVGQPRAARALDLGLEIADAGFNIFASGLPGTGKATTIAARVREIASHRPVPNDWCYVFNFADAYRPTAITLPSGRAADLARDVDQAIEAALASTDGFLARTVAAVELQLSSEANPFLDTSLDSLDRRWRARMAVRK
jgi:hypothetical protein